MSVTNILSRLFQDGTGNKLRQEILPPIPSNLLPQEELDAKAAHAAGPSAKYIDISLSQTGMSYTAPADGEIALMAKSSAVNAVLQALVYPPGAQADGVSYIWRDEYVSVGTTFYAYLKTRVSKGQVVQLSWARTESFAYARFIYVNGNVPE